MTPSVAKNPQVIRMPKARAKQAPRARISYMNEEQIARFLQAAREYGKREYAMFLFGLAHGARASEIAGLKLSDINWKTEQVRVARVKGSLETTQSLLRVKGNPLFNEAAAFKDWLGERKEDAGDFVFNSPKSVKLSRIQVYRLFREIAKRADLPEALRHPHCLKHSAAMLLVNQGANAFMIKQALGHRNFDSTLQYVNPSDSQASEALGSAFGKAF